MNNFFSLGIIHQKTKSMVNFIATFTKSPLCMVTNKKGFI